MVNRKVVDRVMTSATLMTWLSYVAKSFQLVLLAPLASLYLTVEYLNVLLIILTMLGLSFVADMGVTPAISRVVSQLRGVSDNEFRNSEFSQITSQSFSRSSHLSSVEEASKQTYLIITIAATIIMGLIGCAFLVTPIGISPEPAVGWVSWGVVVVTMPFIFYFKRYVAFYEGAGEIAVLGQIKTVCMAVSALILIIALLFKSNVIVIVAVVQLSEVAFGLWLKILRERRRVLLSSAEQKNIELITGYRKYILSRSWKSGVGLLLGFSVFQFSGLIFSQYVVAAESAAMLMSLRVLTAIRQFSNAPFYTKIPTLNRLYVAGKYKDLLSIAKRSQKISLLVFLLISLLVMIVGGVTEKIVLYPSVGAWYLMAIAGIIERYGAMHLQIYSLTGDIVWHKLNGLTAFVYLLFSVPIFFYQTELSIPLGIIISYSLVYTRLACRKSMEKFDFNIMTYDFVVPAVCCGIISLSYLVFILVDYA